MTPPRRSILPAPELAELGVLALYVADHDATTLRLAPTPDPLTYSNAEPLVRAVNALLAEGRHPRGGVPVAAAGRPLAAVPHLVSAEGRRELPLAKTPEQEVARFVARRRRASEPRGVSAISRAVLSVGTLALAAAATRPAFAASLLA